MSNQAQFNNNAPATHFDLHGEVGGYLSRIRWVTPKQQGRKQVKPFLCCSMFVPRMDGETIRYTYLDLKVVGAEAIEIIKLYEGAETQVYARLRISDVYVDRYEDKATHEERLSIKGRVLKVLGHEAHASRNEVAMTEKYGSRNFIRGLGYLNRVADTSRKLRACSISALSGEIPTNPTEKMGYVFFDPLVADSALTAIERVKPSLDADKAVLIGFEIDDFFPDSFTYQRGKRVGEIALIVKGQLTRVSWAKVDGVPFDIEPIDQASKSGTRG